MEHKAKPLYTKADITVEFLKQNDGKIVWIRDDYLCMRNIAGPGELLDLLDHVAAVKEQARASGVRFTS